ncbi:hypothetical protein [Commensalibacter communis]|nr:hypothetical protein [Commensalibacter communis]
MNDLKTIYGVQDLYDFLEIIMINNYNEMVFKEQAQINAQRE